MKQFLAFLLFFAFSAAETQTIWKDVFEVSVVSDLGESNEENEKKMEFEDKIFYTNPVNQFLYFPRITQKQNCFNLSDFYNSTYFPVNTPPPEI